MEQLLHFLPRHLFERAPEPALTTVNGVVMSVVYVTAAPTFSGVIGGYSTVTDDDDTPTTRATNVRSSNAVSTTQRAQSTSSRPVSQAATPQASNSNGLLTTGRSPLATNTQGSTNTAAFGASATDSSSASTSNEGMSMGAKLGLAIGITAGIGFIAILILFFLARKRKQKKQREQADTEKSKISRPIVADNAAQASPDAPRLSLRPVSRLVPEFMGGAQSRNRSSQGNMLAPVNENGGTKLRSLSPVAPHAQQFAQNRPRPGENPFRDPENPFADPEKAAAASYPANRSPVSPIAPPASTIAGTGVANNNDLPRDQRISGPNGESFPIPLSQVAAPVHSPRSGSFPASTAVPPVTTHYELPAAPSPVVAQGPGPESPQGNVYRILMDFRPTMEDELELRAGQLVRLLHEYDDGWALCIRLDRSQQGVVPRTCLAAKPSKPRPGPPPPGHPMNPHGRPRGPPGPQAPQALPNHGYNGPAAQASGPGQTAPGAFNQSPRPLSPGPRPQPPQQKRSMSPGPYGASGPRPMAQAEQRRRSNSVGALSPQAPQVQRLQPPGPSRLGPSPVPVRSNSPGLAM